MMMCLPKGKAAINTIQRYTEIEMLTVYSLLIQ